MSASATNSRRFGALVHRNARERGLGRDLPTDWFTEDVNP